MRDKFAQKRPRFHPGIEWEGRNLTNDFVDVSRMALDDEFSGKNAAPLSKRRNGIGYTDGKTQGLFGLGGVSEMAADPRSAYFLGGIVAVGAYTALDYLTYKKGQSQLRRMINRTPSSLLVGAVAFSLFAPSS
tara:strand:- start:166 stop:564 length:399 start_codon:yes stop_codon:yes gene_type:complete